MRARPPGALKSEERRCVKVLTPSSAVRALLGATLVVVIAMTASLSAPAQAHAITRAKILKRANHWVKKRVPYSQGGYYKGYRRDCSGFVSMSWKLKKSYTTRTISKRATRIKISSLKPGDAVLKRGHVSIFGGWKNKKKRTYYALEETTWGSHAKKRVRKIPRGAKALRRKGLTTPTKRRVVVTRPRTALPSTPPALPATPPSTEATSLVTPSVETTVIAPIRESGDSTFTAQPISSRTATSPTTVSLLALLDSTTVGVRFVV